jgi:hypothetical protein
LSLCYTALQRHYFNWNGKFNSTQRSSLIDQSTPFNSALAIAGSIEEQIAEPFEAIGEAVAFIHNVYCFSKAFMLSLLSSWSFCAEAKELGTGGYERQNYQLKY